MDVICPMLPGSEPEKVILGCKYIEDKAAIGAERMILRYAQQNPGRDLFIFHTDIVPISEDWQEQILKAKEDNPNAGVIGCKLRFPDGTIQANGGTFDEAGNPIHILEDTTGYRKVDWCTYGAVLITAQAFIKAPHIHPRGLWSYVLDTIHCLDIKKAGLDIVMCDVEMTHHESRDNKVLRSQDPIRNFAETHNLSILKEEYKKWLIT